MVGSHKAARRAVSTCHDQLRGLIVEVTLLVVHLDKRREIIIADAKVQSQASIHFVVVLNECAGHVLPVAEVKQRRDGGGCGQPEQFIRYGASAAAIDGDFA